MTHKQRRLALGATIATVVGLVAAALPASADNSYDFASSSNASDPAYYKCYSQALSKPGWCLTTSQDRNEAPINVGGPAENYYPMSKTLTFFSLDGLKWDAPKVGLDEKLLKTLNSNGSWVSLEGTKHQWAPAVRYLRTPGGRAERPVDNYFMYTPNLINKNDKYSARTWVTYSTNPSTGFGNQAIWGHPQGTFETQIVGIPTAAEEAKFKAKYPLYISDPDVFTDSGDNSYDYWDHEFDDYLIWADGDAASCGGISMRKMTNQWTVQKFSDPNQAWLNITGLNSGPNALGQCVKKYPVSQTIDRPYLEGASLFHSGRWSASRTSEGLPGPYVLVFAAKPQKTPAACSTSYGEPGTANEVIAYATSNSVTGPYAYQGIIMCGSSTEWTNQATIEEVKATDGTSRLVLIYHDGPRDGNRNRQLHAECLYASNGKFLKTMRSSDGVSTLNGVRNWCLNKPDVFALNSKLNGKVVSATSNGLAATATYIGTYEQFSKTAAGNSVTFGVRRTGQYVATSTTQLKTNAANGGNSNLFTLEHVSGTSYRIKDVNGRYIQTKSDGKLAANSTNPGSSDSSYIYYYETLSN